MNLEQLRAFLAELDGKMRAMLDENPEGLNEEQSKEYDQFEKDFDDTRSKIEKAEKREENQEKRTAFLGKEQRAPLVGNVAGSDTPDDSQKQRTAFLSYVRHGKTHEGTRALSTSTDTKGGYLVPETYANEILAALPNNSPMRKYATVIKTDGTFNIPIAGAKPTFGFIDELGTYPKTDGEYDNKVLEAWKVGGIIQVAEELLADESFNLVAHLNGLMIEGIGETEGTSFLTGDGVKKPLGLSQSVPAGNTKTLAVLDTLSEADVEDLYLSVKAKYRKNATWFISDAFFKKVFKMKNANGEPIWSRGMTEDEPGRIYGRPYEIDDSLTGAAGEPLAFFGDMKYYQIGDRGQMMIQRLDERYADEGMVGFKVYKRTDGKLTIDETVAMLQNAAS